jgi:hypothetical protein
MTPAQPLPNVLSVYRNQQWGYSLRRPATWHQRELEVDGGHGVLFAPDLDDLHTVLSIELRDLGTQVVADDLADLEQGFLRGLRAVPGSNVEQHEAFVTEFAIGIDAVHTFAETGQRRKRWIRLLHHGSLQARLIAQGSSVAEFDYLRPLLAPCMTTFMFDASGSDATPELATRSAPPRSDTPVRH